MNNIDLRLISSSYLRSILFNLGYFLLASITIFLTNELNQLDFKLCFWFLLFSLFSENYSYKLYYNLYELDTNKRIPRSKFILRVSYLLCLISNITQLILSTVLVIYENIDSFIFATLWTIIFRSMISIILTLIDIIYFLVNFKERQKYHNINKML